MGNIFIMPFVRIYDGLLGFRFYGWSSSDVQGPPIGLILLGNTGVGKSLLANVLLNEDLFRHDCSPSSVTHQTEWKQCRAGKRNYVIFNIPGLIENDQGAIERNKKEIQRAFENTPYAIVVPIFQGGASGRLREEDLVAFNVLNNAYKFERESLLFVMNDLPTPRPRFYEGQTYAILGELVNMKNLKICFLNRINTGSSWERTKLRKEMLNALDHCTATIHKRHGEVILLVDRLKILEAEMKRNQDELNRKLNVLQYSIDRFQNTYESANESNSCTIL